MILSQDNWPVWSSFIAAPSDPEEYSEAAVQRLMAALSPYVVDVKNVRPQFKALNRVKMIDFECAEDRERYDSAYVRYLEACQKVESSTGGAFAQLVEWLKFRQEAELIRAPYIAGEMYRGVQEGYAAVAALNFKATEAKIAHVLYTRYKVPRSQISLIWGGSSIYSLKQEDKISMDEIRGMLAGIMRGEQVDPKLLAKAKQQLLAQNAGLGDVPPELDLGPQNYEKRQVEIDRFQSGQSLYCLFNFKSGGVGLSLHHSDALTIQKVRRKSDSAYAYVEDIPNIPIRPRITYLAPTYSAIELVQGLGRVPRITSLSDTLQTLVFYRGTIEAAVAAIVSQKLRCLKHVVRQKESWESVIVGKSKEEVKQIENSQPAEDTVDGGELFELDNTEEEDEE